jgi:amino acid adenylation domain-containing protein
MNDPIANLTPGKKRELLAQLLRKKAGESGSLYPLSFGQRALWLLHRLAPDSAAYNLMFAVSIYSHLDIFALQRAFQKLIDRHPSLRTTYKESNDEPVQQVNRRQQVHFMVTDASTWNRDRLNEKLFEEADRPFDLEQGPILRVNLFTQSTKGYILLMTLHHIAADFWSLDVISGELRELYTAESAGIPANLPPATSFYPDFVQKQAEMLSGPEGERQWQYWRKQLAGPLPVLDLPTDFPRPPLQTYHGDSFEFKLDRALNQQLKTVANARGMTLYMILVAALKILLSRSSGQEDILVGSPMAGRNRAEWEKTVGYFVNPVVFRTDLSGNPTFNTFAEQVRGVILGAVEHQDYPFPLLVERLQPPRDPSRSPLFQAAFFWDKILQFEEQDISRFKDPGTPGWGDRRGFEFEPLVMRQRGAPFDLVLSIMEAGQTLTAVWQYNTDLFEAASIARMAGHFQTLLESIAAGPHRRLLELPLLSEVERHQLLLKWNDTRTDFPHQVTIHELFATQVKRKPEATAVTFEDQHLTYGKLDRRANQLGHHLQVLGVGPEKLAGICMERSLDMVTGILGILKAGGAYVPLDPGYPGERLAFILKDSGALVLLTGTEVPERLPEHGVQVVSHPDWEKIVQRDEEKPTNAVTADNMAYTIYTSGSTGKPKGVQIIHRAVVNFLLSMSRIPGMTERDILLSVTTLSFDIAVLEIFLPISTGASFVLANRETVSDGKQLLEKLIRSDASVMQATPATWRLLLEAGWTGDSRLKILCGGETLPRELADLLLERGAALWNLYGPTETTIWSTVHKVESLNGRVPIGRPIDNTQVYLLDSILQPVPIGVPGELYIGGTGLARGYLHRPGLTKEKFMTDPFGKNPGARLYKSGDLARYLPDGTIEFLGRSDYQVKVRGFRIEPEEIEMALGQHPAVREAVVLAREDAAGNNRLTAYLIPGKKPTPTITELRGFLDKKLPAYMVPSAFLFLDALPLTPNGKVDRKALPTAGTARPELDVAFAAPRDPVEELLVGIWARVLGINNVGIHDNFFDLGGASIQTIKVSNLATKAGLQLTPELLFEHQTVARLAEAIAPTAPEPQDTDAADDEDLSAALDGPAAYGAAARGDTGAVTIIESLGVYLPPKVVSTKEVLQGCKKRMMFPLERMTGIKYRRMAGEGEFSIDLAKKAISDCLSKSKYCPKDIHLLICCNISRFDAPNRFSFEPNTSIKLKRFFRFDNALAFDIGNACTGIFTAINIVDAFIKVGMAGRAMVVSGEYISHLTGTAQKEIKSFMDSRLACLTLGDAGVAMVLEKSPNDRVGFHKIEMYTLSRYSSLCIAKTTDQEHGGAIMYTDSIKQTAVSIKHAVRHSAYLLKQNNWAPESFQHILMHQTSETALRDAIREINAVFGRKICNEGNTIFNLAERGNTATTTHCVALRDNIMNNRINPGDKIVFAVTGSGQTIGTALYTFDDLPDRMRRAESDKQPRPTFNGEEKNTFILSNPPYRIRVESVGTIPGDREVKRNMIELAKAAAEDCLKQSLYDRSDIDLLIHTGIYRNDFLSEPAIAALLAGELKLNDDIKSPVEKKTFAFDVFNSSLGFLNACYIASQLIRANKFKTVMIAASEIENNTDIFPGKLRGLKETGSAVILDGHNNGKTGFGNFIFKSYTDFMDALSSYTSHKNGKTYLQVDKNPDIEDYYLEHIPGAVHELLEIEGLDISQVKTILPPQISSDFIGKLSKKMNVLREKYVDIVDDGKDYFTSSFAYAFQYARRQDIVKPGDIGLIINVGSGIQVGCAIYYF